ncbi:hypothetical protein IFR05_006580 [Cadophora sp. M221]|nr:hypothetical protein IFR05_006580 [Cadophora sp. M221]
MSSIAQNIPVQDRSLVHPVTNLFGNLIPTEWTISAMSFRGTALARQLATKTVVRNVDISRKPDGSPQLSTAYQILYWQNFLVAGPTGQFGDWNNDVRSCILEAAMAQCVGLLSHAKCNGAFTTCVDVGPLFPANSHPLVDSCPGCYYHGHGQLCSCRP